jgi:ATP-dependent protease ClpP protease subunit
MMRVPQDLMHRVQAHLDARNKRPRAALPDGRGPARLRVESLAGADTATLYVLDEIGYWGISAADVMAELAQLANVRDLTVRITSPGGDVFDGIAIYNALADHPAQVTVMVEGLAASAASFIAQAGDVRRMNRGTQMMIHDAAGMCVGNASDMAEMQALLDRVSDTIASIYADRSGGDAATWREAMRAETWYGPDEAVAAGLADETAAPAEPEQGEPEPAMAAQFDLTVFAFAGRAQAPAPQTSRPEALSPGVDPAPAGAKTTDQQKPEPVPWDQAAFIAQMREVVA